MADGAFYVGACRQVCDTTLAYDTGVNSALGYTGTNSGGRLVITDSVFMLNHAGVVPNSRNNDDAPPPQDGRCPGSATRSCTIIDRNLIADNNNANAPSNGATAPVGTGIQIAGGSYDTVTGNVIADQGSWGVVTTDNPDPEQPPPPSHCQGGIENDPAPGICLFRARRQPGLRERVQPRRVLRQPDELRPGHRDPVVVHAAELLLPQRDLSGTLTSAPADIEARRGGRPALRRLAPATTWRWTTSSSATPGFEPCPLPPSEANYPKQTRIVMLPLPRLASMPDPCAGVPKNAFCS